MRKLHKLLMAALVLVPLAACDEGDNSVTPDPVVGTVSGTVAVEGTGLAGVTVALAGSSAQSTTTGANGSYSFTNVVEGNYSVNLSSVPEGVVFSQTSQSVSISTAGQTATADFNGQYVRTASILVSVTAGGDGVATNVRLQGTGVDQTLGTNANGTVQFSGLRAGSYTVSLPNPPEGFETTTQTVQLNTGQSAQVNFTGQAEITPAEISIQSITQGGAPINLSMVAGQIEVTLNVDRGGETLDHVDVLIGGKVVASQSFASADLEGPAGAPVSITLNVPTTQVRMGANGQWVPVVFNGGRTVSANLFVVERESPTPSNEVPVVMQNVDAILSTNLSLTPDEPARTAQDGGGTDWYAGDATFTGPQYLAYSTVEPTAVSFTNSVCAGTSSFDGDAAGGMVVTEMFDCSGVEGALTVGNPIAVTVPAGPGPDGTAVTTPTAFSGLGAQFTLETEMRRYVLSPDPGLTLPAALNMDNVGPTVYVDGETGMPNAALFVAFNDLFDEPWVNASYMFAQDITTTDGGVGVDPSATQGHLWVQGAPGSCTGAAIDEGDDLGETIASDGTPDGYQLCGFAADLLGNESLSGPSNWFGVDKVAPSVRLHGTTAAAPAIAGIVPPVADSAANSTVYGIAAAQPYNGADLTANTADDWTWGVEALDERSGFNQNAVAGFPVNQAVRRTTGAGQGSTAGTSDLSMSLSDTWVRTSAEWYFLDGYVQPGYFRYRAVVTDRAGNSAPALQYNWLVDDANAPSISFVSFDQTFYNVGQNANFVIFGQDDLEVINATMTIDYATVAGTLGLYNSFQVGARWNGLDPFDASAFTTAVTGVSVTIPNVLGRIDFTCSGAAAPYPGCAIANGLAASADYNFADNNGDTNINNADMLPQSVTPTNFIDAGYNESGPAASVAFNPLQWQSSTAQPWTAGNIITWRVFVDGSNTKAQHMATTSIEDPFFDAVRLVLNDAGTILVCGTYPAPVLTDNGLNRFWTYTIATPTSGMCADALVANPAATYHAMGVKGSAALVTQGI